MAWHTVVVDHEFYIAHDFGVATMSLFRHLGDAVTVSKDACWLGVEDERHGEEALDPFWRGVSMCRFGGVERETYR